MRMYVKGTVIVRPSSARISLRDVQALRPIVELRCPVAAMMVRAGVDMHFEWRMHGDSAVVSRDRLADM